MQRLFVFSVETDQSSCTLQQVGGAGFLRTLSRLPTGSASTKRSRGNWLRQLLLAGALCTTVVPVYAQEDVATVSVAAAQSGEIDDQIDVVGTIVAREETLINVDLDGAKIVKILVEEGDAVESGQLLATLDATKIEVELLANDAQWASAMALIGQAQSAVETAKIMKREAEADLKRGEMLNSKGVLADETLEQRRNASSRASAALWSAEQALSAARANVLTSQAQRKDIEVRLERTRITATAKGKIIRRSAKVGAIASSSGAPLFVIATEGELELEAEIPQSQLSRLHAGAASTILLFSDLPPVNGQLRFVAPALAIDTRMGRVRIALPKGIETPIGAFARAEIHVGKKSGVFLPSTVLVEIDGNAHVMVIKQNRIEQRSVETGFRRNGLVEIVSGLGIGDIVVLKAANFVSVGDAVTTYQVSYDIPRTMSDASATSVDAQ
jgi:RND family efflux transporter MFP subunit